MPIRIAENSVHSWLVLSAGFVALCIESGLRPCLGVYFLQLVDELDASQAAGAAVFAVANSITFLAGPIVSAVIAVAGLRVALMLGSLLAALGYGLCSCAPAIGHVIALCVLIGVGSGLVRNSVITAQADYFTATYRNLAMAAVMIGPGVGVFIFPPVLTKATGEYGWRGSMLINAALLLQCSLAGALLMKKDEGEDDWKADLKQSCGKLRDMCAQQYWLDATFVFQGLGLALAAGCGYTYYALIIAVMVGHGMSPMSAALSLAIQGAAALAGRFVGTALVHCKADCVPLVYAASLTLGMATQAASVLCFDATSHGIVNLLVGLTNGVFFVANAPFMVHAYGPQRLVHAIGWIGLYNGLGGLVIPKIAADRMGTDYAFVVAAASGLGASLFSIFCAYRVVQETKRKHRRKLVVQSIIKAMPLFVDMTAEGGDDTSEHNMSNTEWAAKSAPTTVDVDRCDENGAPAEKTSKQSARPQAPSIIVEESMYEFESCPNSLEDQGASDRYVSAAGSNRSDKMLSAHTKVPAAAVRPRRRAPLIHQQSNPTVGATAAKAALAKAAPGDEHRTRAATESILLPLKAPCVGARHSPTARSAIVQNAFDKLADSVNHDVTSLLDGNDYRSRQYSVSHSQASSVII